MNEPSIQSGLNNSQNTRGYHIALAVTAGIAAYKAADLASKLIQENHTVKVIMTLGAQKFIAPLTFQSLTNDTVATDIFETQDNYQSPHISISKEADILIIAPATADFIAKLAHGITDNIVNLIAAALPQTTPILIAPAMNDNMWTNPILQQNIKTITTLLNVTIVGPGEGWQACRTQGKGRMASPEQILETATKILNPK